MFPRINPTTTKAWQKLEAQFLADRHLLEKEDIGMFQKEMSGQFSVDYQYGLWSEEKLNLLLELVKECELPRAIDALFSGEKINDTENRAVSHTALRDFSLLPVYIDVENVKPEIQVERQKIKPFVDEVHNGEVFGCNGKRIQHIINIEIGGSSIGPRMVVQALGKYRKVDIQMHYISTIEAGPIVSLLESYIPVLHALLGIWYTNFHGCHTSAIIPYSNSLRELKLYLQQAAMESNGKSVDRNGEAIPYTTCPVIWGEVGNNALHSFFQLLNQGTVVIPAVFILIEKQEQKHTNNHQLLLANYQAQLEALTQGRDKQAAQEYLSLKHLYASEDTILHRVFAGRKPVTPLILKELTPKSLGSLLAMYSHTYFVQGVIWNIYSYDQWGVEHGETLAKAM